MKKAKHTAMKPAEFTKIKTLTDAGFALTKLVLITRRSYATLHEIKKNPTYQAYKQSQKKRFSLKQEAKPVKKTESKQFEIDLPNTRLEQYLFTFLKVLNKIDQNIATLLDLELKREQARQQYQERKQKYYAFIKGNGEDR